MYPAPSSFGGIIESDIELHKLQSYLSLNLSKRIGVFGQPCATDILSLLTMFRRSRHRTHLSVLLHLYHGYGIL